MLSSVHDSSPSVPWLYRNVLNRNDIRSSNRICGCAQLSADGPRILFDHPRRHAVSNQPPTHLLGWPVRTACDDISRDRVRSWVACCCAAVMTIESAPGKASAWWPVRAREPCSLACRRPCTLGDDAALIGIPVRRALDYQRVSDVSLIASPSLLVPSFHRVRTSHSAGRAVGHR